jgi:hypothetical protein
LEASKPTGRLLQAADEVPREIRNSLEYAILVLVVVFPSSSPGLTSSWPRQEPGNPRQRAEEAEYLGREVAAGSRGPVLIVVGG